MKLLHTSDWHLGRSFHGVGTLDAQHRFADQLLATVAQHDVDVVLIAGDVYDRALPNVDVVRLFDSILARLNSAGVAVVISSGNHDSATRLGFGGQILEQGGVFLRTRVNEIDHAITFPLTDSSDGAVLAIYGIPFLEPRLVADQLGVQEPSHFTVTEAAVGKIKDHFATLPASSRSVVLAHTFASGGITSESERELTVGGLGAVPLDLFDGLDYVALGHLHGRQKLSESVRYSGSPLPYSFSEAKHTKGGWIVELTASGVLSVEAVDWPVERALSILRGKLEELLASPEFAVMEANYCQITLTDDHRPANAMERLRGRFPHTLVLMFEPENLPKDAAQSYSQRVKAAVDELDLCCGFLDHVRQRPPSPEEKVALGQALANVHSEQAAL